MDLKVLKSVRLIVLDVDGVLTDGGITIDSDGKESKTFCALDGAGIKYLQRCGIQVAFLSGRPSKATVHRARELGIEEVHHGIKIKLPVFEEILKRLSLQTEQACFVGDDLTDLPVIKRVGFPATVPAGHEEVKKAALYITTAQGGMGAVREIAELILKAQGQWRTIMERYT